jgi:hypothetical protein
VVQVLISGAPAYVRQLPVRRTEEASRLRVLPQCTASGAGARAQVSEWLSFRHTELTPLTEDALLRVDARLLERTFLVGGALTLADLALFDVVHRAVVRPCRRRLLWRRRRGASAALVLTAGAAFCCMTGACHQPLAQCLRCAQSPAGSEPRLLPACSFRLPTCAARGAWQRGAGRLRQPSARLPRRRPSRPPRSAACHAWCAGTTICSTRRTRAASTRTWRCPCRR